MGTAEPPPDASVRPGGAAATGPGALRALVLTVLAVPALAALAFVVLGLLAGPPQTTVQRLVVAPWRTTVGDAATAAGFAVTVAGLVLVVRAGQVGPRRSQAADTLDALDGPRRRRAAAAVAGHEATAEQDLPAARALALVVAARWSVAVLFAGLLLSAAGRAVVAADLPVATPSLAAVAVLTVLLAVLARQVRRARGYLLHHPDRSTPPAVVAALARWTGAGPPARAARPGTMPR